MSILKMRLNGRESRLVRYNPNKGWITLYDDFDLTSILNGSSLVTLGSGPDKYTEVTLDSSGTITLPDNLSKYNKIRVNIIENLSYDAISLNAIRTKYNIGNTNIRFARWHFQYPYYCITGYSDNVILVNNGATYNEDDNPFITAKTTIGGNLKSIPSDQDFNVMSIEVDKSEGTIQYYLNQLKLAYRPLNSLDFLDTKEFKLDIQAEIKNRTFSYKITRLQILALK